MKDSTKNNQQKRKRAVVAGHVCLDVLPDMGQLPRGEFTEHFKPGHLISVGKAKFATGGPVSNVGLALHKLGIPTQLIAKIGADPYGRILQRIIADNDPSMLRGVRVDQAQPTSYSIIISPPGVDRIFLHCPGVNDAFEAADIDFDLLAEADLIHFGYPPIMRQMYANDGAELTKLFRKAKQKEVTTSLDMAFPDPASPGGRANWQKILANTLPYVDLFTPSVEEIMFMLHREKYEALSSEHSDFLEGITANLLTDLSGELLEMGAKMILLKLGHRGAYLRTADQAKLGSLGRATPNQISNWIDQEIWSPCFQVDVVGTTGSGDATIAGFLSAFLRESSPCQALNYAVAVGACNVEATDALSGLCSWEKTLARITRGRENHPLNLDAPGWIWDNPHNLWIKKQNGRMVSP